MEPNYVFFANNSICHTTANLRLHFNVFLQYYEFSRNQFSNCTKVSNTALIIPNDNESMLITRISIISNKPLMVFTGTYPEYSFECYLNAVTAILNVSPEHINTPLKCIHIRTALIQNTLDMAAQK